MCNKYGKIALLSAFVAAFVFAANVQAETVVYDFDGLMAGVLLDGQDGWEPHRPDVSTEYNIVETGAPFSGNYVTGTTDSSNSRSRRMNDASWSYSLIDDVDFSAFGDFLVNCSEESYIHTGLIGIPKNPVEGGLDENQMKMTVNRASGNDVLAWGIYLDDIGGWVGGGSVNLDISDTFGDTFEDFIITLGFDVTAQGSGSYSAQSYYQVGEGGKTNVDSPLVFTVGDLGATFDGLYVRTANYTGSYPGGKGDNIGVSQIPEPGTLALLATGLAGLLAYAWRKRK